MQWKPLTYTARASALLDQISRLYYMDTAQRMRRSQILEPNIG